MPAPERHWCFRAGSVLPHARRKSRVRVREDGLPSMTSGFRFCRTLTTVLVIVTSVPHAPMFTLPSA
jgi:hypothetical protein